MMFEGYGLEGVRLLYGEELVRFGYRVLGGSAFTIN